VRSRKGLGGGYELSVSPDRITLLDIVRSVDGEPLMDCLLEDRACSCTTPCELHESWSGMRDQFVNYLRSVTVADLAGNRQDRRYLQDRNAAGRSSLGNNRVHRGE
jgi:Rrf2 family protein